MYAELIQSQLPQINEYAEAARTQWQISRHPENLNDVIEAAKTQELNGVEKTVAVLGTLAAVNALGPGNEMELGFVAGHVLKATDGILPAIGSVGATTTAMELLAGLGTAYAIHKFSAATDIVRKRYIKEPEETSEHDNKVGKLSTAKKFARVLAIVSGTGTGSTGASIDASLHDHVEEGRHKRTKRVAIAAASALGVINTGYATVILGASTGAEAVGVSSATDYVADFVSNPIYVGSLLAGLGFGKAQYDYMKLSRKYDKEMELSLEETEGSSVAEDSMLLNEDSTLEAIA